MKFSQAPPLLEEILLLAKHPRFTHIGKCFPFLCGNSRGTCHPTSTQKGHCIAAGYSARLRSWHQGNPTQASGRKSAGVPAVSLTILLKYSEKGMKSTLYTPHNVSLRNIATVSINRDYTIFNANNDHMPYRLHHIPGDRTAASLAPTTAEAATASGAG